MNRPRRRWDESLHPRDDIGRFSRHPGMRWASRVFAQIDQRRGVGPDHSPRQEADHPDWVRAVSSQMRPPTPTPAYAPELPEPVERTPTAKWPFSYEPESEIQFDYGHLAKMDDEEYANSDGYHLVRIPVNSMVPTQDPDDEEWGDANEYGATGKPFAVDLGDGLFYLIDGHHRAQKAGKYGSMQVWVRPIDTAGQ